MCCREILYMKLFGPITSLLLRLIGQIDNFHDYIGQDCVCQRIVRPVRNGRNWVRQHAHAVGSLHKDDGEGEGRRNSPHNARIQGMEM